MQQTTQTPTIDPKIFWDTAQIDYQKSPMTVIFRVLRYDSWEDFKALRKIYDKDTLKKFLQDCSYRIDL